MLYVCSVYDAKYIGLYIYIDVVRDVYIDEACMYLYICVCRIIIVVVFLHFSLFKTKQLITVVV